jgi:hypothetical protein
VCFLGLSPEVPLCCAANLVEKVLGAGLVEGVTKYKVTLFESPAVTGLCDMSVIVHIPILREKRSYTLILGFRYESRALSLIPPLGSPLEMGGDCGLAR